MSSSPRSSIAWVCSLIALASHGSAQAVELAAFAPADLGAGDLFGAEVALSGDRALVGVPGDDDLGVNRGAAEVFLRRDNGKWVRESKFYPVTVPASSSFGTAVALQGTRALVAVTGVSGLGYVSVRERDAAGAWPEVATLPAPFGTEYFGFALALDGDRALVGALSQELGPLTGSAHVFDRTAGGVWNPTAVLLASDAGAGHQFGLSVALVGDRCVVGAPYADGAAADSGAAYVFEKSAGGWAEVAKLTAAGGATNAQLGGAVALRGERALIGARNALVTPAQQGAAYLFERASGGAWQEHALLQLPASGSAGPYGQGSRVALGDGVACVGTRGDGSVGPIHGGVLVWREQPGGAWTYEQALFSSSPHASALEPSGVALDGTRVALGDAQGVALGLATGGASVFELQPLSALPAAISVASGGAQTLLLDAGHLHAAKLYLVLGSASGTQPGTPLGGGLVLPLVADAYFAYTLASPNQAPLAASFGALSQGGTAICAFALPAGGDPGLAGLLVHHAFVALELAGPSVAYASPPAALALVP
jgi:hypothetical protein